MKWTQQQLTVFPVALADAKLFIRQQSTADDALITDLIAGCTQDAEDAMQCSLLQRTITAVYYEPLDPLYLPRGPVQSITSVTDANGTIASYSVKTAGTADYLCIPLGFAAPLTVVYIAGIAADAGSLPAKYRSAIKLHIGTLYQNRTSVSEKNLTVVPHSLELFWQRNSRGVPVL